MAYEKATGTLYLANEEITADEWHELAHRINTLVTGHAGIRKKRGDGDPNGGTSNFLTRNLTQILKRQRGVIKNPPFWFRVFYDGVITKEEGEWAE